MASICRPSFPGTRATDQNPHKITPNLRKPPFPNPSWVPSQLRFSYNFACRCQRKDNDAGNDSVWPWGFDVQKTIREAIRQFDKFLGSSSEKVGDDERARKKSGEGGQGEEEGEWDWERWRKHFAEVDEQERIVSVLKSQLARAVDREDYEDAARLKVAIAAAATNDTVGRVMSHLKRAVEEERYGDAVLIRDYAGAGLVGWWSGISDDADDPYGRIIHISAEHGRYVARSYSPRQLASSSDGSPLFEVFLTRNKKDKYKQQAVYLKRKGAPQDLSLPPFKSLDTNSTLESADATRTKTEFFDRSAEDTDDGEDKDDESSYPNVLKDMIPGVQVKVVKVTTPDKVDRDLISKVIEQIIDDEEDEEDEEEDEEEEEEEEEAEEKDYDLESVDDEDAIKAENDEELNKIELGTDKSISGISNDEEQAQIAIKLVVGGGLLQNFSSGPRKKDLLRVPAKLEQKSRLSFTFTVEEDDDDDQVLQSSRNRNSKLQGKLSMDNVMLDLVKSIGKGKIPGKVLKDVGEMINLTLNQARNRQPLSGSTTFNRIDMSVSSDPLNGVYIGSQGLYTSEVIHLRRRFGQWKDEGRAKKSSKLEFYEYVEAVKLTGDPYVPAGQIAFRAKVGKRYQLPHKGIIPEEFGVVARYKGQGRLAEPGFKNPRWVDGELVILDGKYIKGGPVVGFVYWAPDYHFLVFFSRLRLQD